MSVKNFAKLILSVIEDETEKYGDGYALASIVSLCEKQIKTKE